MHIRNPVGTNGLDFLELTTPDPKYLVAQFKSIGFHPVANHLTYPVMIYQKHGIRFIINLAEGEASQYARLHGTAISAMGFKVRDANTALQYLTLKGATSYQPLEEKMIYGIPAIYGVGNTLIYLVDDKKGMPNYAPQFSTIKNDALPCMGASFIKNVTHYLYRGNMDKWADFYTHLFNFHETTTAEEATTSGNKIMLSPCGKIRLPLYESSPDNSNIEVFLDAFNGEGIQQISLDMEHADDSMHFLSQSGLIAIEIIKSSPDATSLSPKQEQSVA